MGDKASPARIPPGPKLEFLPRNGARLLSLDGGGVKGVSSVLILDAIMNRVRTIELETGVSTSEAPRKPADYFDLAGGTSTGGLIALMLFRLRMDTQQCLAAYRSMASTIFAPTLLGSSFMGSALAKVGLGKMALMTNVFGQGNQFSPKTLKKAIKQIVNQYSDLKDPWKDYLDKGESILLRSYTRPADASQFSRLAREDDLINGIKIVPAARATSAALGYFPEEKWQVSGGTLRFWDGGVLNNNPVE